ncbi:hypothetical protein SLS56_012207 [Neofusicoccum ribis]|uniref:Uncharacterized protein n=1 Tax=Neofusicoccum ribis TaxID=45134 RepID=A0ABR3S9R7_9PEZI
MASASGGALPETEAEIHEQIRQTEQRLLELNRKLRAKKVAKVQERKQANVADEQAQKFMEFITAFTTEPNVGSLLDEMEDLAGRASTAKERSKLWDDTRDAVSLILDTSTSGLPFHRFTDEEISALGEFKACMEADKMSMEALCDPKATTVCRLIREMERKTLKHCDDDENTMEE